MDPSLLNIGFWNFLVSRRIVAIISSASAPVRRLREEAKDDNRLIDATHGRRTRSVIITDSNHVILSGLESKTIAQRFTPTGTLSEGDLIEA
jgi:regulator of extracellular matrix RemA (YlzA/DUF370 family)